MFFDSSQSLLLDQLSFLDQLSLPDSSDFIAGVDEVGRGALFGPVVAAAVILPSSAFKSLSELGVTDSKKLTHATREQLTISIQDIATDCKIGIASVREIDRLNILYASLLAMKRAIRRLNPQPQVCLIDGNQRIPDLLIHQHTLVKGDEHSIAIAAASIIAKVWRDRLIIRMATKYPQYDLAANKGYGTPKHRLALDAFGPCPYHRRSFKPCQILPSSLSDGISLSHPI
ncbi:MAG: ribonuclease HII [Elainellaceae cyanobacterium]